MSAEAADREAATSSRPCTPPQTSWFEFLLEEALLEQHLQKPSPGACGAALLAARPSPFSVGSGPARVPASIGPRGSRFPAGRFPATAACRSAAASAFPGPAAGVAPPHTHLLRPLLALAAGFGFSQEAPRG